MEVGVVAMIMVVIMAETVMWRRGGSSVRVSGCGGGNSIGRSTYQWGISRKKPKPSQCNFTSRSKDVTRSNSDLTFCVDNATTPPSFYGHVHSFHF